MDRNKAAFFFELFLELGTFPRECKECLLNFRDNGRVQVVCMAISRCWECLRLIDRTDLRCVDGFAINHPLEDRVRNSGCFIIFIRNAEDRVVVLARERCFEVFVSEQTKAAFQNRGWRFETRV